LQVSELESSVIDPTTLSILDEKAIFFWKWNWIDEIDMEDGDAKSDICVIPETPPDLNDSDVEPETIQRMMLLQK